MLNEPLMGHAAPAHIKDAFFVNLLSVHQNRIRTNAKSTRCYTLRFHFVMLLELSDLRNEF